MNRAETTGRDPIYSRLAGLSVPGLDRELSERIRRQAHGKLVPRRFAAIGTFAVSVSVALYLSWALVFTSALLGH